MKILVFGAGVLGCNLARNLCRAGKDVTLLARGKWAEEIKQNGLRIKNQLLPFPSVTHIPVVTELSPDAAYDVIFVVVRYTQLENLLEPLRKSRAENIVFVSSLNLLLMLRISAERAVLVFLTFSVISESWLFAAVTEPTTMLMFDTVTTSEMSKS